MAPKIEEIDDTPPLVDDAEEESTADSPDDALVRLRAAFDGEKVRRETRLRPPLDGSP